ncbi:unnamed protein product [Brassicogethes aeneus]|uniref:Uncharacterized protein n=1 Tax=Brassicogethes aeneus TaxID=1431903 RepID=A0A9P0FH39_BRAAE|nr:unnamed protein product [Brassicogethes aeneus]
MVLTATTTCILNNKCKCLLYNVLKRTASSRPPQTVFIEKILEDPVVVLREEDDVDLIGPPDAVSNLRPIIRKRLLNETPLQVKLRELQDSTHAWNNEFWAKHNTRFVSERLAYIESHQVKGEEQKQLTADEMSEFYKSFLDKNWRNHVNYNVEWYRKNFTLLFLALRVSIEKSLPRIL